MFNNAVRAFLAFIFLFLLMGCQQTDPVVKIGLVAPFEGEDRLIGYDVIYSARLAVREINEAGGINGYRVALVALDDGGNIEAAADVAHSLRLDPNIVAVLGHWQPETTAVGQEIYDEAQLLLIPGGEAGWGAVDPTSLTVAFQEKYEAVTPFDEKAGPYAWSAYQGMQELFRLIEQSIEQNGEVDRQFIYEQKSKE